MACSGNSEKRRVALVSLSIHKFGSTSNVKTAFDTHELMPFNDSSFYKYWTQDKMLILK